MEEKTTAHRQPDLAVFVASLANGGVGKMRVNLINEFAARGLKVDLLVAEDDSPYMQMVSKDIRVFRVGTSHAWFGIPRLARYLRNERPRVMMTQRARVNVLTLRAQVLAGTDTRIFVTANTNLTRQLNSIPAKKRRKEYRWLRKYYPRNAGIIAVSHGVAEDIAGILGWATERVRVAPNPVITNELFKLAAAPLQHPWFAAGQPPVIVGMGRLEPQKDFPTLLRAFALMRRQRPCRLLVLGEGKLHAPLTALAAELGVAADVALPGFQSNPYPFLANAHLFVLSSAWEGSPNGLTEALALGTPLVATDCPNGPVEVLEQGKWGPLVPVGDVDALARAMQQVLDHPPDRETLRAAARRRYTVDRSADAYLQALGLA